MTVKRLMVAFACLYVSVGSIAQVKESVVRVRPIVSEEARETYLAASRFSATFYARFNIGPKGTLQMERFKYLADSKPVFSGFLIDDGRGQTFVLTCRYGMVFAEMAEIAFTLASGKVVLLKNCPIVYKDTDINVALVRISGDVPEGAVSLVLDDQPVTVGQEIWAAGFVQKDDYQTWQFSRGVITNLPILHEDWGLRPLAEFIHHSAPITDGCFGGPVLVSTGSGYKVAGLNSWVMNKGGWYQCGAVPAYLIREALGRMKVSDYMPEERMEDAGIKASFFAASLTAKEFNRFVGAYFISDSLGADKGWYLFKDFVSEKGYTKKWADWFFEFSSGETMRHLVWYRIYNKLHSSTAPQVISTTTSPDSRPGRFLVRTELKPNKGKEYYVDWGWESGNWLIFSTNALGPSLVSK